jgi:hypothetical protein
MASGGGYGATINAEKGNIVFGIIRENGTSEQSPEFPHGMNLTGLTLHEAGHAFVNPSLEQYQHLLEELHLAGLYTPVQAEMERQAYPDPLLFFQETVVRGLTVLALMDLYGMPSPSQAMIHDQEQRGFYLTAFTVQQLQNYRIRRHEYPRFDMFIPTLLKQYATQQKTLLKHPIVLAARRKSADPSSVPAVIATTPQHGEILKVPEDGVDYLISVTYDRTMKSGYSWCTSHAGRYPEKVSSTTKPQWDHQRTTNSMMVKIYPNMNYAIEFNVEGKHEKFRSAEGISALPYLLQFTTVSEE